MYEGIDKFLNFEYQSNSFLFNKASIVIYDNIYENSIKFSEEFIAIEQKRKNKIYLLDNKFDYQTIKFNNDKKIEVYSELLIEGFQKINEFEYDLEKIVNSSIKEIRRGRNFFNTPRSNVEIVNVDDIISEQSIVEIYNDWVQHKRDDPKVFQRAFAPARYKRSFRISQTPIPLYFKIIRINGEDYGAILYSLKDEYAYEITFVTKYYRDDLKIINDLNSCLLLYTFFDLHKNHNIKYINAGTADFGGLKKFKQKFPYRYNTVYYKIYEE